MNTNEKINIEHIYSITTIPDVDFLFKDNYTNYIKEKEIYFNLNSKNHLFLLNDILYYHGQPVITNVKSIKYIKIDFEIIDFKHIIYKFIKLNNENHKEFLFEMLDKVTNKYIRARNKVKNQNRNIVSRKHFDEKYNEILNIIKDYDIKSKNEIKYLKEKKDKNIDKYLYYERNIYSYINVNKQVMDIINFKRNEKIYNKYLFLNYNKYPVMNKDNIKENSKIKINKIKKEKERIIFYLFYDYITKENNYKELQYYIDVTQLSRPTIVKYLTKMKIYDVIKNIKHSKLEKKMIPIIVSIYNRFECISLEYLKKELEKYKKYGLKFTKQSIYKVLKNQSFKDVIYNKLGIENFSFTSDKIFQQKVNEQDEKISEENKAEEPKKPNNEIDMSYVDGEFSLFDTDNSLSILTNYGNKYSKIIKKYQLKKKKYEDMEKEYYNEMKIQTEPIMDRYGFDFGYTDEENDKILEEMMGLIEYNEKIKKNISSDKYFKLLEEELKENEEYLKKKKEEEKDDKDDKDDNNLMENLDE